MICQVTIDKDRYVTAFVTGGMIENGIDIAENMLQEADWDKINAYYLSAELELRFDPDRWAQIEEQRAAEQESRPPSPEERIAELEAALHLLMKGEGV